jgi:NlpC/P60 family putative phage cell wall peptidase
MTTRNLRKRILRETREWIGTPYRHQASVRGQGADCLGLIRGIWRKLYGDEPEIMPSYSSDWNEHSGEETLLAAASRWFDPLEFGEERAGDLVLFHWRGSAITKHVGILSGRNRFIHAYEKSGVVETTLGTHWRTHISACFRFPDPEITGD